MNALKELVTYRSSGLHGHRIPQAVEEMLRTHLARRDVVLIQLDLHLAASEEFPLGRVDVTAITMDAVLRLTCDQMVGMHEQELRVLALELSGGPLTELCLTGSADNTWACDARAGRIPWSYLARLHSSDAEPLHLGSSKTLDAWDDNSSVRLVFTGDRHVSSAVGR